MDKTEVLTEKNLMKFEKMKNNKVHYDAGVNNFYNSVS